MARNLAGVTITEWEPAEWVRVAAVEPERVEWVFREAREPGRVESAEDHQALHIPVAQRPVRCTGLRSPPTGTVGEGVGQQGDDAAVFPCSVSLHTLRPYM